MALPVGGRVSGELGFAWWLLHVDESDEPAWRRELRISVIAKDGLRLLRVSRYSNLGSWKYEGTTFVTENQKLVRLYLSPVNGKGDPIWAIIKLHYISDVMECSAERLVPIMTVQASDKEEEFIDYKMERVGSN